jgi:hypothetical protein
MSVSLQKNKNIKPGNLQQKLHWYIIMGVSVVGLLVVLGKGIQLFVQINYGQDTVIENEPQSTVVFDLEKLETAIDYFDTLNKQHSELRTTTPNVTDPS